MKRNFPFAILVTIFLALALFYSLIIPLFEGPDEDAHFRYAKFIADTHALPVQDFVAGGGQAGHQGWQPPLYYSLAALVISPLDTTDYGEHLWRNDAATFVGDPACCGRNIYFHTAAEDFPFTRTTLAVHIARWLSIFWGAVTVWAAYQIAREIFKDQASDLLPLAVAAVVAFNPSFLFASALVSNDAMLAALSSLVLLLWVRLLIDQHAPSLRSIGILGILLSLALLTKTTALGLLLFSVLLVVILAWRLHDVRYALTANGLMLAIVAGLAGWWFVRNQILYSDPLAYRLMMTSALFPRSGPLTLPELFQISLPWLWQTFWGGPTPGDFSPVILVLLGAASALAVLGLIPALRQMANGEWRIAIALLAAWLGFILAAQIQFIRMTTGADQGRYLFPAIPAFALLFVLGLGGLVSHLASRIRWFAYGFISLLFLLACFVPFAYTLPAYAHPALASEADLARISHPTQITFADQIQLVGYDIDARSVKPGEVADVALYWRALTPMHESYRVFAHLIGAGDTSAGGADVVPARGAFPTVYWEPGNTLRDVVSIPVAMNARPGKYAIEVGLYSLERPGERLMISGADEDHVILDAIKIAPREPAVYTPQTRLDANFGDRIKLIGYDWNGDSLVLYWQCLARVDRDYTVFVHALDDNGKIIAQADREPQAGNYPTSLWDIGEQVRDEYPLTITGARVAIGLYRADTLERLPVGSSDHVEIDLRAAR